MPFALLLLALMLTADANAQVEQVDPGKAAYVRAQCDFCHGPNGTGAMGPGLVPFAKSAGYLMLVIRRGIGLMPAHRPEYVSDADVKAIYSFLRRVDDSGSPTSERGHRRKRARKGR